MRSPCSKGDISKKKQVWFTVFDVLEAYLNLMLPASFWILWDLAKHYVFVSGLLISIVALFVGFSFFVLSLYRKEKEWKNLEGYHLASNRLMGQSWLCLDRRSHRIKPSPAFEEFIGLSTVGLSFEALLLAVDSQDRLHFRKFSLSSSSYPSCTTVSFFLKSRKHFRVTRTLLKEGDTSRVLLIWQDVTELLNREDQRKTQLSGFQSDKKNLISILDALPWPLWVADKDSYKITYCNEAYASSFDASKEDILTGSVKPIHDLNQSYVHGTQKHFNIKGARKFLELQEAQMESSNNVLRFAFDRTEEQVLSKKLEHYLALYREVLETLSAGVVIYGPDKRVNFYNHAYIQMFGMDDKWLSSGPLLGEVLDDLNRRRLLSDQADYPNYKKRENNMVSGLLTPFQELMYLPDERTIRKITAPHPAGGIFYIFEDVTTSLELERRFNTHIQVQKSTLENLYEGIAVFGSDNRLRFTNPAFRKLWNWAPADLQGEDSHLSDLLEHAKEKIAYKGDWDAYKEKLVHRLTDRVPKTRQVPLKDNRFFEISYTPLPDGSHLFGFHDVTSFMVPRAAPPQQHVS